MIESTSVSPDDETKELSAVSRPIPLPKVDGKALPDQKIHTICIDCYNTRKEIVVLDTIPQPPNPEPAYRFPRMPRYILQIAAIGVKYKCPRCQSTDEE